MSHLNYFEPYQSRPAGHEDQLTRAFLVLLRMVPLAFSEFLERVRNRQPEAGYDHLLPRLSEVDDDLRFETQTSSLDTEREWLVSLLMTDEHLPLEDELGSRERRARYDGVLSLADHILTIENKPHREDVWKDQMNPDLPDDATLSIEAGARPVVLPWKEMIQALTNLRNQGRFDPTSMALVDDFLAYVDRHFDYLNPYPTFAACQESRLRINKRCAQILRSIGGEELVQSTSGNRHYLRLRGGTVAARRMYLHAGPRDADEVEFISSSVHPADLVDQARPFYKAVDRDGVLALEEDPDWRIRPNLHLSYRGTHLVYTSAEPDPGDYLDYWIEHRDRIGRVSGVPEMKEAVGQLYEDGWFTEEDVERFEEEFVEKRGSFVDICPGVSLRTKWPIQEARDLDDGEGRFVEAVRERLNPVLGLWGQQLPAEGET